MSMNLIIGARLREERKRLGLTQEQMARIGGVQRRAQCAYEAGERSPDALYLSQATISGPIDVLYVLAGMRGQTSAPVGPTLPPLSEQTLIEHAEWLAREISDLSARQRAVEGHLALLRDALRMN